LTSTKIQINHNDRSLNIQNYFKHLNIDIWNLFVILILLFGASFQKLPTL